MNPAESKSLLAYSPMLHARLFAENPKYRAQTFQPTRRRGSQTPPPGSSASEDVYLDGRADIDRPLFVQFCANDPDVLLEAARHVQPHCDAVDLNLGCPQGIARKGRYGAFLQEDWDLVARLIHKLHTELEVPVTAKIRILETKEKTLAYATKILDAGASILTVHGRQREQKGHKTGLADWKAIRYLRDHLPPETVLFANGNILYHGDVQRCLEATGADGVMSAEGQLYNAALFAPTSSPSSKTSGLNPKHTDLALEYLEIVKGLKTKTSPGAVKAHLFKIMRPALEKHTDLRERLGKIWMQRDGIEAYEKLVEEMRVRLDVGSFSLQRARRETD